MGKSLFLVVKVAMCVNCDVSQHNMFILTDTITSTESNLSLESSKSVSSGELL